MKAVERMSVVQQVVNNIEEYIREEKIAPGEKLPTEMEFCDRLAVGRGTLREALRVLQGTGIVEIKPGRGTFLARQKPGQRDNLIRWFAENEVELKDINEVRIVMEPLATRLAIQRATDQDIRHLKQIQDRAVAAVWNGDSQTMAECDEQFHQMIMTCSGNKLLIRLNQQIASCLALFRSKTFLIPQNVDNFIPAHAAIIEAFEKRDVALGERRMIDHLLRVNMDLELSKKF